MPKKMSLSCCICKQGNVKLYKDSLSKLIFCGTTCQTAFFIQGQTKRGRQDDEELEKFQEDLSLFKATALADAKLQDELRDRLYRQIKMALKSGNLSILSMAKDNGLLNFGDIDMVIDEELYLFMTRNVESLKFCLSNGLGSKEIDKLDLLNITLDPEMYYGIIEDDTIDFQIIQLLIKAGANVNRRSKQHTDSNYTPLFFATLVSDKFSVPTVDVLKYLIDNGANITIGLIIAIFEALSLDAPIDEKDWAEFLETNDMVKNLKYLFSRLAPDFDLLQRESLFSKLKFYTRFLFLNEFLSLRERAGLSRDVAIIIVAREVRNILNRPTIPENLGRSHLLTLARFLRVPQQIVDKWTPLSKAKLASYISSVCAIGGVWDGQKFRDHRNLLRTELLNTVERFRRDMAWTFDIETEGKALDQIMNEANQSLN